MTNWFCHRVHASEKICEQRIRAAFVGEDLTVGQLEKADKQGVDVEKIVDSLCLAKQNGQSFACEELVETELRKPSSPG
ncbi:hypothetical protein LOC67_15190 [Stieleria sp. JC731]|uniref:hypothetical protein n=1 Tax=Stieleria sp. JC731 TaxID=2894195 RepID=UPI001E2C7936|nr:hypothetical protein [Stieleria sp. JC731]MCC9601904.1 hypothetical protein [Stieleria sp. JC731]